MSPAAGSAESQVTLAWMHVEPGAVCSKTIDYAAAVSRTSMSTSSIRPMPHGLHSWHRISGTLPSFGIVRVNCIGSVQHGQSGASGNSLMGISARRQNNGIAPNQAQGDPADESTGQLLPNLQRPYWSRSGHCGFQPAPYLCHMNDSHLKIRLPAQRRHQLDEITRRPALLSNRPGAIAIERLLECRERPGKADRKRGTGTRLPR